MKPGRPTDGKSAQDRLSQTYEAIAGFIDQHGYPPTVRQLGDELGLSSSASVQERLDALEKAGMVERVPGSPRAIILKDIKSSVVGVAGEVRPPRQDTREDE